MFGNIEKVFPVEQCLSEDTMLLVESVVGKDIVNFFNIYGPNFYGSGLGPHIYTESPFTLTYQDVQTQGINYAALGEYGPEMAELRDKLLSQ